MQNFLTNLSSVVAISLSLLCLASGQSAPDTRATLSIGCTDIYTDQHTLFLRQTKNKKAEAKKIELNIHSMSEPFSYKGGSVLSFYRTQAEAESLKNESKPTASCRIPSSGSFFLLLIPRAGKTDAQKPDYRILVIPAKDVAYGSFMLMNYSSHPLHAAIGTMKGKILSGKRKAFPFRGGVKNARAKMFIEPSKGKLQLIRSSKWSLAHDVREFVILYNAPDAKGILFKHIVDKKVNKKSLSDNL